VSWNVETFDAPREVFNCLCARCPRRYKTEMCRTFHTTGFCPYGLRCHFIHNDDERRPGSSLLLDPTSARHPGGPGTSPLGHRGAPTSPTLTPSDGGLPLPHCRPLFRSPTSSSPTFEVDCSETQQRGRPILARGSTVVPLEQQQQRSLSTYSYDSMRAAVSVSASQFHLGDLTTTGVHAPCA